MNAHQPQRLRQSPGLRRLRTETRLSSDCLIQPIFFSETATEAEPIVSLPGISRHPMDDAQRLAHEAVESGLGGVLLFGIPKTKDDGGHEAWNPKGVVPRAIRAMREAEPDLVIIADVCLCEYTSHGHCAPLTGTRELDRPAALEAYGKAARVYAEAGCSVVAPSGRMDGQVAAIRRSLDAGGLFNMAIMSYSVKHASVFYGPFRDAAGGAPTFGDRRSHQLNPANAGEAMAAARLDVEEGADMLMVKPGMSALDLAVRVKGAHPSHPLAIYQVSGEYAMLAHAAAHGAFDLGGAVRESFIAFHRAGADLIISYFATEASRKGWL